MIFPLNRLRLLNGNKMNKVFCCLMGIGLFVSSCSLFEGGQSSSRSERTTTILQPESGEINSGTEPTTKETSLVDTLSQPVILDSRGRKTIALLLPFALDQRSLEQLREQNPLKRNRPLVSLGFYEGALIAIDSLRKQEGGINVLVYDTKNSAEEVRRITAKPEFHEVDLIIGPVFEQEIQEASNYARQKGIPIVSPLRKVSGQQDNPSYFAINPGEEALMNMLAASHQQTERNSKIIIVRQEKSEEIQLCQAYKSGISDSVRRSNLVEITATYLLSSIQDKLSANQTNVLIVPSKDEVFVNSLCRKLSSLQQQYSLKVFGLEDWRKFESIAPESFLRINLHYPVHYYPGIRPTFKTAFEQTYKDRFYGPPGEYAYYGYDLMMYFGRMMQVYGQKWPGVNKMPSRYPGMNEQFRFKEVSFSGSSNTDHNSNQMLHIVRFQQDGFRLSP